MKKLLIVGIILIVVGLIFFVLSGVYSQIYQEDIQKAKTTSTKVGSSTPFFTRVPNMLNPERDVIHGSILLCIGIGIAIVSRRRSK
jgi:hypothetical protein